MVKHRLVLGVFLVVFMVLLTACGGGTVSSGPQEVQVTLSEFKIASSLTTFSAGRPYHFVVTNKGKLAHEFMIMPKWVSMSGMSMVEMHSMALTMIDSVAPGETKTFNYTFAQSTVGQGLEFACHMPEHYEAGMELPLTVST